MSSARATPSSAAGRLERVTVLHVAILGLLSTWAFGGGAAWARTLIAAWGSLGLLITLAAVAQRDRWREHTPSPLAWLWPAAALGLLVILGCLNPSFTAKVYLGESLLAYTGAAYPALPSSVLPSVALDHLWLFAAIYLSCFNLALTVRRRRSLRHLLVILTVNAAVLSVLGTFQKLASDGLFFGLVRAPNPRFFATFVYSNHWAAYLTLQLAAGVALLFYQFRRAREGAPNPLALVMGTLGLVLMALTPALAGSRAGIILTVVLLGAASGQALLRVAHYRRTHGQSARLPVAALVACVIIAAGGAAYLGSEPLRERWRDTQGELRTGLLHERIQLYRDTLQLAEEKPVFGWGLGSFERTLQLIRPRPLEARRQYEHSYVEAHSDWLQALAELGLVGTALIALCGLVPLWSSRALAHAGTFTRYLFGGCGLVLAYAAVEFPFANPAVTIAFWTLFFAAVHYVRLNARTGAPVPPCSPSSS